ncbi:glycosyltransferase [Streptosporangiaceae bacterium NEAU-GS5]|nr:glycosyltransferase [Streptosporangiaceae bacterium NEAU-GS5]
MTSVVIPAHNEARVIGRLLAGLLQDATPGEFDVVVVANGCTDDTVAVADGHGVRVEATPVPSKRAALRLGDEAADGFPRVYVDADVELDTASLRTLAGALQNGVHAAGPERDLVLTGRPWRVRAYYTIWVRLPHVRTGLFGRGVIALSEEGNARVRALPQVMADDLAVSVAFEPHERTVIPGARVRIQTPRTFADLMRRRVRVVTGVSEIDQTPTGAGERTSPRDLLRIVLREPNLLPAAVVFLSVALLAKRRAAGAIRSGDYSTWLRDESSRA